MTKLEKALILPQNGADRSAIPVLFNPGEYSIERTNVYQASASPGMSSPLLQFVNGNADTLSMELFFDTYTDGGREDVRKHTGKILDLTGLERTLHAPPIVRFVWGRGVNFKAVLERVTQKFTMFLSDGTPVRATLSVVFKEYKTIREQLEHPHLESSDLTKRVEVHEGDRLWTIAYTEYGDPAEWRLIASANEIDNPRLLEPALELRVPSKPAGEVQRAGHA